MAGELKQTPAPPTEILSVKTREANLSDQTSPNEGLPPAQPAQPANTQTVAGSGPFTIDETGQPAIPPVQEPAVEGQPAEPTGDPLTDTQRAYHQSRQEIAQKEQQIRQMQEVLSAVVLNQQMGAQRAPQPPPVPNEFFNPEPTEEEKLEPWRYTQRMDKIRGMRDEIQRTEREMYDFTDRNPDWQEHMPKMQQIAQREPWIMKTPGGIHRLLARAKEQEELETLRSKAQQMANQSFQAGVNAQQQKGPPPFVAPSGAPRPTGSAKDELGRPLPPKEFVYWDVTKQKEWMQQNGYYKYE